MHFFSAQREKEEKVPDDFPPPVNLPLSTYSFFSRNFLFAFRLSERATAKALCTAVARNANVRALTVLGNQVEILSDCREPSGGNHFRKENAVRKAARAIVVIERPAVFGEYVCTRVLGTIATYLSYRS